MRVKTSITIDKRILKAIDLAILNESVTDLNKEMEDVLDYQANV